MGLVINVNSESNLYGTIYKYNHYYNVFEEPESIAALTAKSWVDWLKKIVTKANKYVAQSITNSVMLLIKCTRKKVQKKSNLFWD